MNFDQSSGLIPAIIQDEKTNQVLMLGYLNEESYAITQKTGKVTFYSRSRQALWVKGETSGNFFNVVEMKPDCDSDAILIRVNAAGPACHRLTETCFDDTSYSFLGELQEVIEKRFVQAKEPSSDKTSYTVQLIQEGLDRIIQKVGEEAIETVIAAKNEDNSKLESEAADLIFHLMVLLRHKGSSLIKVVELLKIRHSQK